MPRRRLLVTLDLCRAGLVFLLPFVTEIWQVYVLVFAFQSFSAAFTPTFQATIPDILTDEREYTSALSLSRLAYDLEALVSPLLAGALLAVISFHWLFVGTTMGFLASAILVMSVALPVARAAPGSSFLDRLTLGSRIYLATPRLRGLLALSFAAAAGGAMVIVNTVVHVREALNGTNEDVALLFAAFGLGSMTVAIALTRILDRLPVRAVMVFGAAATAGFLMLGSLGPDWAASLLLWSLLGAASSMTTTPGGLLLRRSCDTEDRPAVFAAQFALSHACWLIGYLLAGWLGAAIGLDATFLVMAAGAAFGGAAALVLWPVADPVEVEHEHAFFAHDTWHIHDVHHQHDHEGWEGPEPHRHPHRHAPLRHVHPFVIDEHHPVWPAR